MTKSWYLYKGDGQIKEGWEENYPDAPHWRLFGGGRENAVQQKGKKHFFQVTQREIELVNAALYLRRPLLLMGPPGTGKSTLALAVAHELSLGEVLVWPINSRSTLQEALYSYDAIGRLQETSQLVRQQKAKVDTIKTKDRGAVLDSEGRSVDSVDNALLVDGDTSKDEVSFQGNDLEVPINKFLRLGPLGTAMADSKRKRPRVLLIDEIDKSDIDLPNDLLHLFETGKFMIPELARYKAPVVSVPLHNEEREIEVKGGHVICSEFPFVIITSNQERELPAPFLRRCLQLNFEPPDREKFTKIVEAHFGPLSAFSKNEQAKIRELIEDIVIKRDSDGKYRATDQLLNAIYLINSSKAPLSQEFESVVKGEKIKEKLEDFILREIAVVD